MKPFRIMMEIAALGGRTRLLTLLGLILLGGGLEVFGIGLLFPYIALLQEPEMIRDHRYLSAIYNGLAFSSDRQFLVTVSFGLFAIFLLKALFGVWLSNYQLRFIHGKQAEFGERLLSNYLHQPYTFFLSANTSTLIGNLTTALGQLCGGVIQSGLTLLAETVVLAGLIGFLVYLSPVFSLLSFGMVSLLAFVFIRVVKSRMTFYARENDERWKAMIRIVNESLSAAKELQVLVRTDYFIAAYGREARAYADAIRNYSILSQLPRATLETIAVGGMALFAAFALLSGHIGKELFAVLAVFAMAIIRIVPSTNRILQAWNAITFYIPAATIIAKGLRQGAERVDGSPDAIVRRSLQKNMKIDIRSFRYPDNANFKLHGIKFEIEQGQSVAFIGHSGSGKTTLIDIILGAFRDFDGQVTVDDRDIRQDITAWRRCIGYIPQSIYLRDDTITRNVAFGVADSDIMIDQVKHAVHLAGLDEVIKTQPAGLDTIVGDRGIRLSGGERQRIGIARALYHDPDLLVMDEATSALDNATERQIIDSILGLSPAKTIIVIAHRLSTVEKCDVVHLMKDGAIVDSGLFRDVAQRNPGIENPHNNLAKG